MKDRIRLRRSSFLRCVVFGRFLQHTHAKKMHTLRDRNTVGASMLRIKQKSVTKSLDPQSKIINTFAYNQLQNDGQNSSIDGFSGLL